MKLLSITIIIIFSLITAASSSEDSLTLFKFGSHKGYLTYEEAVKQLDTLALLYPDLISVKSEIGRSFEGRSIWMVKISDNTKIDESSVEPAIYYDALHHGCEAATLSTMMYYICWLLETYKKGDLASYIVNNRELFFVPFVNPDGYIHNLTDPSVTGWRKNRRLNSDSSYGVDINRNYSVNWGNPVGSSNKPDNKEYCGTAPFSESETQAIRDLTLKIKPTIAFTYHSYGQLFLNAGLDSNKNWSAYTEFASEFVPSEHLYGLGKDVLGYKSSGSMRDYLDSAGTLTWTVEMGNDDDRFWPKMERIIPIAKTYLYPNQYVAMVGGAYARIKSVELTGNLCPSDTVNITIGIRNRGLRLSARNVSVNLSTTSVNASILTKKLDFGDINKREDRINTNGRIALLSSAKNGDIIPLIIAVTQENMQTDIDTIEFVIGNAKILVYDNAENGSKNWKNSSDSSSWDTTSTDCISGKHSFTDSRIGNSVKNTDNYFTLEKQIDLSSAQIPYLEFFAKWSLNSKNNYVRFMISSDSGKTWNALSGKYTSEVPPYIHNNDTTLTYYKNNSHWVRERISLKEYTGKKIMGRFHLKTPFEAIGDGFYFDDFQIADYSQSISYVNSLVRLPITHNIKIIPAGNKTLFNLESEKCVSANINIFDCSGRSIWSYSNEKVYGKQIVTWNQEKIVNNFYTAVIQLGNEKYVQKLIKLK